MKQGIALVALGDLVTEIKQRNKAKLDCPVFSVTNSEGFKASEEYFKKQVFSKKLDNYKVVPERAFAYNPSRVNVGSIDYLRGVKTVLVSPLYVVFETDEQLAPPYLKRFLKSSWGNQQIRNYTRGAVRDSLQFSGLKRIRIPLPPLVEQKRIAEILDAADALRTKRRESLAQLDTLRQSTFLDMFGDPVTNPMGFPKEALKSVFEFTTGKLDSNAAVEGGQYPFFTCARETFAIDDYAFDCEALLLAGNNANADYSVKHHKGKFNAYQRTYVITVDESMMTYSYARLALEFLLSDLKRFSKGTNTKYLTMVILNGMPILVPPLDLQRRFATIVESVEQQKARHRAYLDELDTLFASLQSRAFRGAL